MAVLTGGITTELNSLNGEMQVQEAVLTGTLDHNETYLTGEIGKSATWGLINGDINDQTDLLTLVNAKADASDFTSHTSNVSNPHTVTKAQVGLGNVDNTSDLNKPISTLTQAALDLKVSDVTVNGQSVVSDNVAAVVVPTLTSDLINDSGFISGLDFTSIDETTLTVENGVLMVNVSDTVQTSDYRPVTSHAVDLVVGNINALLETI